MTPKPLRKSDLFRLVLFTTKEQTNKNNRESNSRSRLTTLSEINIVPEKWWLEVGRRSFPFGKTNFQGLLLFVSGNEKTSHHPNLPRGWSYLTYGEPRWLGLQTNPHGREEYNCITHPWKRHWTLFITFYLSYLARTREGLGWLLLLLLLFFFFLLLYRHCLSITETPQR